MLYLQMLPSPSEKDKFEQIYTLYRGLMFYIARRILPGEADAEDAVHQAFVSIIENLKKISEVRCPKTRSYVVIITERKAIDILRSRSRLSPEAFEESTRGVELPLPGMAACRMPSPGCRRPIGRCCSCGIITAIPSGRSPPCWAESPARCRSCSPGPRRLCAKF